MGPSPTFNVRSTLSGNVYVYMNIWVRGLAEPLTFETFAVLGFRIQRNMIERTASTIKRQIIVFWLPTQVDLMEAILGPVITPSTSMRCHLALKEASIFLLPKWIPMVTSFGQAAPVDLPFQQVMKSRPLMTEVR